MKCSVVVPVFNPGPSLTRCIDSLLAQTMPARDYEIILVDDGSTDGTGKRLDDIAAAHDGLVRVIHIPGSGWPGRPRNTGIDAARGEYVHFVDNDDVLPAYALENLYAAAIETDADVVFGRAASDFRGLDHRIYRRDLYGTTLAASPQLTGTLTPHKMFRRELLLRHQIYFPDGEPLEDQPFVLRAYLHAASITVLTDRCYYYYLRRIGSGSNTGDAVVDAVPHFAALATVLDIIDDAEATGLCDADLHRLLLARVWRISLLNPLYSAGFLALDTAEQQPIFAAIRELVTTRFPAQVEDSAEPVHRVLAALVAADDLAGVTAFAHHYRRVVPQAKARVATASDKIRLDISGGLLVDGAPFLFEKHDDDWALPQTMAPGIGLEARQLLAAGGCDTAATEARPVDGRADSRADSRADGRADSPADGRARGVADAVSVSRSDGLVYALEPPLHVDIHDDGSVQIHGSVVIDPRHGSTGSRLEDGVWNVSMQLHIAGFARSCTITLDDETPPTPAVITGREVQLMGAGESRALQLDVGQWRTSLAHTIAANIQLAVSQQRRVQVATCVVSDSDIAATALLKPLYGTPGGLQRYPVVLTGDGDGEFTLPARSSDGSWQIFVSVDTAPAAPPGDTCVILHRWRGTWRLEPAPD